MESWETGLGVSESREMELSSVREAIGFEEHPRELASQTREKGNP